MRLKVWSVTAVVNAEPDSIYIVRAKQKQASMSRYLMSEDHTYRQNRPIERKVAFFLPSLAGGGAERVLLNLANGFAQQGYKVDLVLAQATGPYLRQITPQVNTVNLGARRTLTSLYSLMTYLRQTQPEALIAGLDHANLVAIWAKYLSGVPTRVLVTVHGQLSEKIAGNPTIPEKFLAFLLRKFLPSADKIITVSNGVADDLSEVLRLKRDTITTIYNPVVSSSLFEKAKAPVTDPWPDAPSLPIVIAIGRLDKQKDFPNLIRAFGLVRRQLTCKLLILGEGEQRPYLENLIHELDLENDVSLPGFVDNPYAFLKRAQVFVLSSVWEGLPTVLIEALALGVPVVSTDCKSGPREILKDGKYGALVPVGDHTALAEAILQVLRERKTNNIVPVEAYQHFTWQHSVTAYAQAAGVFGNMHPGSFKR